MTKLNILCNRIAAREGWNLDTFSRKAGITPIKLWKILNEPHKPTALDHVISYIKGYMKEHGLKEEDLLYGNA